MIYSLDFSNDKFHKIENFTSSNSELDKINQINQFEHYSDYIQIKVFILASFTYKITSNFLARNPFLRKYIKIKFFILASFTYKN